VRGLAVLLLATGLSAPVSAQVTGHVALMFDALPDLQPQSGNQQVSELRVRVFAERGVDWGEHVRLQAAGYVDALLADRSALGESGATTDALVRPTELYADVAATRFDLRAGMSRVVWGRLDEFQPTDVVNPIDLTRFLLDGRSEARLPVALVRGRVFVTSSSTLEVVAVPAFRASRFDQLDEPSSPFNLARIDALPVRRERPSGVSAVQGGGRFSSTFRRLDWGVTAYRGFRTFPTITLDVPTASLRESFPRFTMVGGDVETVRGPWGVRGELAAFMDDELQSTRAARGVPGRSIEAGAGVDRRAGDYRVAANVLWSWRGIDPQDPLAAVLDGDDEVSGSDLSLVVVTDRSFARETRTLRGLAVVDPADGTVFGRVIAAISLRDNTWVEGSAGIFAGSSPDTIGRLTRRDFLYARLKVFF
jgi:hypothetical protein